MTSYGFCAGNSKGAGSIGYEYEVAPTIRGGSSGTNQVPTVICFKQNASNEVFVHEDGTCGAITAQSSVSRQNLVVMRNE